MDRREALEAAFDAAEAAEEQDDQPQAGQNDGLGAAEPIEDATVVDQPAEGGEPTDEPGPGESKQRGPDGKFLKKPAADPLSHQEQVPPKGAAKPAVGQQQADTTPKYKPPGGWKIGAREKFASLPAEVQEEVTRRETEMARQMEVNAEARNYATSIHRTIQPYEAMIRAEGSDHIRAVDALLKTAYHLRHADPHTKAQMVAQMIAQHHVDPELLDNALANLLNGGGQQQQQRIDPMMQHLQQQLQPINQFMQQITQRQQQQVQEVQHTAEQEYQQFANDPKNVYFEDVKDIMGDLMMAAANRGAQMTMAEAYRRATLAHPEISQRVLASQASASAAQRTAAARRARNASASLPSGSAPTGAADQDAGKPKDRRAQLEAAWDQAAASER